MPSTQVVAELKIVSGDGQRADAGVTLPRPVVVQATDAAGDPVAGVTVAFTPGTDHGTADPVEALSDASGITGTTWTLGAVLGRQALVATVNDASVSIEATADNPDRAALEAFYEATGGPDWEDNGNWLTDAPLGEWHGVATDTSGRVVEVRLTSNGLSGRIPPEIGGLTSLRTLAIKYNPDLGGSIPPQLGSLSNLTLLTLNGNGLSGAIPPELGKLSSLELLNLTQNRLTGSIPPELGELPRLGQLYLGTNDLTGEIPAELGNLPLFYLALEENRLTGEIPSGLSQADRLEQLELGSNQLSGSIPPTLGSLSSLRRLTLSDNGLTGSLPPALGALERLEKLDLSANELAGNLPAEFSRMAALRVLDVSGNEAMSGALPNELAALRLNRFRIGGTGLCVPRDNKFRAWLLAIPDPYAALCPAGSAAAYLTQAVQSLDFPVSLVAGEDALLRVFVTANNAAGASIPPMRATFFEDGREIHVAEVPGRTAPIPAEIDEGSLDASANVAIPGSVLVPGLEMVVEVDPGGTLNAAVDVQKRIPETGRLAVGVRAVPTFDLVVVPFLRRANPDSSVIEVVNALTPDDELFEMTRTLLPVKDMQLTVHEPLWTSSTYADDMLEELRLLRVAEGGTRYYLGTTRPAVGGGVAYSGWGVAFADLVDWVVAHELGHTFDLDHAPCGNPPGVDPAYPYSDGSIGAWGYDLGSGTLVPPDTPELMGYCGSEWISDYHFRRAMGYRLTGESASPAAVAEMSLLLWGGANADGELFLEPAFVVEAPPALPEGGGEYRVFGSDARGDEIFSLSFDMDKIADGDGDASFAFAVPVRPHWADALARITLSGPGGSAVMDRDGTSVAALLRDPATGRFRGVLRDWSAESPAGAAMVFHPPEAGLELQVSRGLPDAEAWRR